MLLLTNKLLEVGTLPILCTKKSIFYTSRRLKIRGPIAIMRTALRSSLRYVRGIRSIHYRALFTILGKEIGPLWNEFQFKINIVFFKKILKLLFLKSINRFKI